MIATAKVWQRVNQLLKSGTSGYQNDDEFNSDMASTIIDILTDLCDNYELSNKVSDLMNKSGLVLTTPITADTGGLFSFPESHYRTFSLIYTDSDQKDHPVKKLSTNEVATYQRSPIRGFNLSKGITGYYFSNGKVNLLPRSSFAVKMIYCIKPVDPVLVTTVDGSDYQTVDPSTTNINLPENLFNLFCYKMLERASIEMKEQTTLEYSQLGISKE